MLRPGRTFYPAGLPPSAPSADEMYPRPTSLAPATDTPIKELLTEYEDARAFADSSIIKAGGHKMGELR